MSNTGSTYPNTEATQAQLDLKSSIVSLASYKILLTGSSSHTAGLVAGTYCLSNGDASVLSGGPTVYPLALIHIKNTDFPTLDGKATKLKLKAILAVNDTAPTGTYIFGLYGVTRSVSSGGAGVDNYTLTTIGVVSGSQTTTITTPAGDALTFVEGSDFAIPADGFYMLGILTTGTVAASSHLHFYAQLLMRNV